MYLLPVLSAVSERSRSANFSNLQAKFPRNNTIQINSIISDSTMKLLPMNSDFVNFELFRKVEQYFWKFQISDRNHPEILLTDDLNIQIIELKKFSKDLNSLENDFDIWIYLLKQANFITGDQMKTLEKKNPRVKKAVSELKFLSQDKRSREYYEDRLKTELDYNTKYVYMLEQVKKKLR
jgi:predicted transposase/invertase (TIGR01784 family)